MKKLLKVLLPPFIGFSVFFIAVRYSSDFYTLRIDEIGEGKLRSFMAYYRYFLPLLFVTGVLTQLLIFVPLWEKMIHRSLSAKFIGFVVLCLICLLFAIGLSYPIWEKQSGVYHLIKLCLFMTGVQVAYWAMNSLVMTLLSTRALQPDENKKKEQVP
jgi:hypothetical protein